MHFFTKVRIDLEKMRELGGKLQTGELSRKHIVVTYCLRADPAVGLMIWEADTSAEFEKALEPYKKYYQEILEVVPVVTSAEAQTLLMKK